ncbi:MAG TPA: ribonuclease E/G, partial [Thermoanaerobaculia bacterium]
MSKEIVINATKYESRIAVLDEGQVVELWVERHRQRTAVGNIYKGRVTKVLPGMQSAFVNIGLERDAFLYVSDVAEDLEEYGSESTDEIPFEDVTARSEASIADLLREGQEIVVQVVKDSIAGKGARITTHVTLPGRFLVYMPTVTHLGISRRIENEEERLRLKGILENVRTGPGGFIVRTVGEGRNEEEFLADRNYLTELWEQIKKRSEKASAPTAVHYDLDLVLRSIRDILS